MKKKLFITLLVVFCFAGLMFFTSNKSFAAGESDNWLYLETTIDDTDYDVSEVSHGFQIQLNYNGEPVNGTINCTKSGSAGTEDTTLTFANGAARITAKGAIVGLTLKLPTDGYSYKVSTYDTIYTNPLNYTLRTGSVNEGQNGNGIKNVYFDATVKTVDFIVRMHVYGDIDNFENPFIIDFHNGTIKPRNLLTYTGSKSGTLIEHPTYPNAYIGQLKVSLKDGEYVVIKGFPEENILWHNQFLDSEYRTVNGINVSDYFFPSPFGTSSSIITMDTLTGEERNAIDLCVARYSKKLYVYKYYEGNGFEKNKDFKIKIKGYTPHIKDNSIKDPVVGEYPCELYERVPEENPADPDNPRWTNKKIKDDTVVFDNNGIAYVTLKGNQFLIIGEDIKIDNGFSVRDIEYQNHAFLNGVVFEVQEIDDENYESTINVRDYTRRDPIVATITNSRKFTGKLIVNKDVKSDQDDLDEEFQFKIKLTDAATDLPTEYNYTGSKEGTLVFEDGIATFTLKANESITIEGLPVGATYEVIEESTGDTYTVTSENSEGTISEGTTSITFTNSSINEDEPKKETKEDSKIEKNKTEEETKKEEASYSIKTGDYIIVFAIILVVSFIPIVIISKRK